MPESADFPTQGHHHGGYSGSRGARQKTPPHHANTQWQGDGVPELRTVFLDHLNSPFGVALVGHDLYVANTMPSSLSLSGWTDKHHRARHHSSRSSWRADRSSLDKGSVGQSGRQGSMLGVGSNSNIGENGIGAEYERAAIWRSIGLQARTESSPAECAILQGFNGSLRPASSGPSPTKRDEIGPTWFRII